MFVLTVLSVVGSFLGFGPLVFFPAFATVGEFGAGRAGDVVEDCGLETPPEPGHCEEHLEGRWRFAVGKSKD